MRTVTVGGVSLLLLIAGCGGDTKTETTTVAAPAATTEAAPTPTTEAETTETTETSETSEPSTAGDDDLTRKEAITVRGRRGDGLTLLGQYATSISGKPKARVKVKVTLKTIRGPFPGFDLAKGRKLIGFDLKVTNTGTKRFDDALPSGMLILVGGENGKPTSLISGSAGNPCKNPSLKLRPGQSKEVCVAFEVPTKAKLQTLQYVVDSGYGDTALWRLR